MPGAGVLGLVVLCEVVDGQWVEANAELYQARRQTPADRTALLFLAAVELFEDSSLFAFANRFGLHVVRIRVRDTVETQV